MPPSTAEGTYSLATGDFPEFHAEMRRVLTSQLRTPLKAVYGWARVLQDDNVSDAQRTADWASASRCRSRAESLYRSAIARWYRTSIA